MMSFIIILQAGVSIIKEDIGIMSFILIILLDGLL